MVHVYTMYYRNFLENVKRKELLSRELGTKAKQTETIFPEDEEDIWNTGIFGATISEALQCTVFFYACQLFDLRGNDEHHDLMCDQYSLGEDTNGRYVEFTGRATKTYKGGLARLELAFVLSVLPIRLKSQHEYVKCTFIINVAGNYYFKCGSQKLKVEKCNCNRSMSINRLYIINGAEKNIGECKISISVQ